VLLHGWPDTPHTWDHQLAALAGAGFRVAAPWLRGYPPTEIPRPGYFDTGTLAVDVRELTGVPGGGDPCLLAGQDRGASVGCQVLAAFPEVVRSAVVMAVPHPAAAGESLLRAGHVHRSFPWFFFQLPELPERALRADGYAFVDWLWDYRTAPGFTGQEHLAQVKRVLAVPGALEATLGCYRAMFDPARADPDLAEVRAAAARPIVVPTLALCGAQDKRAEVMQDQARHFAGPYRFELVPGASHFLQREQPQAVTDLLSTMTVPVSSSLMKRAPWDALPIVIVSSPVRRRGRVASPLSLTALHFVMTVLRRSPTADLQRQLGFPRTAQPVQNLHACCVLARGQDLTEAGSSSSRRASSAAGARGRLFTGAVMLTWSGRRMPPAARTTVRY
jgi:pimeloyl-ACP methyl ester carboxylesterase